MTRPTPGDVGAAGTATRPPRALTIAGSDSGGGAGIQADLKTFEALGVYGTSAVTALTAQDTVGVHDIHEVPASFVRAQVDAVALDIGVDAAKTGMLASAPIVAAVAAAIEEHAIAPLVVDPVAASKHGDPLLRPDAVAALREHILPLASVATPNVGEVALFTGVEVRRAADLERAAAAFLDLGPRWVLVKGGHLPDTEDAVDLLTDGTTSVRVATPRLRTRDTHGTGCTLSAAITAGLAFQVHHHRGGDRSAGIAVGGDGVDVERAVRDAKDYLTGALRTGVRIGSGIGPVDHQWRRR